MLHYGTTIVITTLIVLAVYVFVIHPLGIKTHTSQESAVENALVRESRITVEDSSNAADIHESTTPQTLPSFSKESLAQYDGSNPSLPIYIAFEGNVYDVTEGKRFYEPGGTYHFLAGTDGTELLSMVGGSTIKEKYPVIGSYIE